MAKELPYFRFTVQEWQNGKVCLESYELQGLFISVCGYYWINDCTMTLTMLKKKFSNATTMLDELINLDIMKHEKRHDKIQIDFLNRQYDLLSEKRKRRQNAGSKGGNAKAMLKQNPSYKDKDKDKDKDNKRKGLHLFRNSIYFDKIKFKELFPDWSVAKLKYYYDSVLDWSDSGNNMKKDWAATIRSFERRDNKDGKPFVEPKQVLSENAKLLNSFNINI